MLHFVEGLHVVKDNLFPIPPLFRLIREQSNTNWQEMYKVFNMGHRFELYVPESLAGEVISIAGKFGIEGRIVGHCTTYSGKRLTLAGEEGTYTYGDT